MRVNRRKRFYGALLLFSGVALFVDRCVISRGVTAPESALAEPALTAAEAPVQEILAIPEVPFPHAVSAYKVVQPIRDLFLHPSLRQGGSGADNPQRRVAGNAQAAPAARADFPTRHDLAGVLIDQGLKIAIVDGRWMRTGQDLEGCTLRTIRGNSVVFECSDGEATLHTTPSWNKPGG